MEMCLLVLDSNQPPFHPIPHPTVGDPSDVWCRWIRRSSTASTHSSPSSPFHSVSIGGFGVHDSKRMDGGRGASSLREDSPLGFDSLSSGCVWFLFHGAFSLVWTVGHLGIWCSLDAARALLILASAVPRTTLPTQVEPALAPTAGASTHLLP